MQRRAARRMNDKPARFDPATRRGAIRRTAWAVFGVVVLIYGAFFVRAVLLGGGAAP